MSNKPADILAEIKAVGVSLLKISKQTGIPVNRMYKWYEGKGSPKHEDVQILRQWLGKNAEKVPHEAPTKMAVVSQDAVVKLIESNKILAEANADLAAAHKLLASDQHALMVKFNLVAPRPDPEVEILLNSVAELLLKVGVSANAWDTEDEGREELRKAVSEKIPGVKAVHKRQGASR